MKILTGNFIEKLNQYRNENFANDDTLDYIEATSELMAQKIATRVDQNSKLLFMVGRGLNGSNGLAAARMLANAGFDCTVILVFSKKDLCDDCKVNLSRLPESVEVLHGDDKIPISRDAVIIDAIFGVGVDGPARDPAKTIIRAINVTGCRVISLDIPSGMSTDYGNDPVDIIHASETITVDFPKLAMLLPEAGECCGEIIIIKSGLYGGYISTVQTDYMYAGAGLIKPLIKHRLKFTNKADYGHALLVCGSATMTGAAVLATGAALRSGCGRVTTHLPERESFVININCPAAMVSHDPGDYFSTVPNCLERYTTCGVGCGLGRHKNSVRALEQLMVEFARPMVFDADALNIIAANPGLRSKIPAGSVLTPHLGEFERLVGKWDSEKHKLELLRELAAETDSVVALKGYHTVVCTNDGKLYINSTGTAGMATGGAGDVLAGLITGLMARGYSDRYAALLGVYVHGMAGEKSADFYGIEGMNSSDIIDFIGESLAEIG